MICYITLRNVSKKWGRGAVGRTNWSVNTPEEILHMTGTPKAKFHQMNGTPKNYNSSHFWEIRGIGAAGRTDWSVNTPEVVHRRRTILKIK